MARLRVVVVARTGQANVAKGGQAQNVIRLEKGPMPLTKPPERHSSGSVSSHGPPSFAGHVNNGNRTVYVPRGADIVKRSPLSFATHVSWPVSSRQHHQMKSADR